MKEAEKQHQTELEQALSTSGQQIREIKDSAARAAAQAVSVHFTVTSDHLFVVTLAQHVIQVKAVRSEMEHSIEDIRIAHEQKVAIMYVMRVPVIIPLYTSRLNGCCTRSRQQCNDELNHKLETQRRDLENEAEHKLSEALSAAAKCTQEVQSYRVFADPI